MRSSFHFLMLVLKRGEALPVSSVCLWSPPNVTAATNRIFPFFHPFMWMFLKTHIITWTSQCISPCIWFLCLFVFLSSAVSRDHPVPCWLCAADASGNKSRGNWQRFFFPTRDRTSRSEAPHHPIPAVCGQTDKKQNGFWFVWTWPLALLVCIRSCVTGTDMLSYCSWAPGTLWQRTAADRDALWRQHWFVPWHWESDRSLTLSWSTAPRPARPVRLIWDLRELEMDLFFWRRIGCRIDLRSRHIHILDDVSPGRV